MALSDLLLRLGAQAKDLEDSASALRTGDEARLTARADELRTALARIRFALGEKIEADTEVAAGRWATLQRTVSDGFETLRAEADAEQAELDAEDAIEFAVHALQEAEYHVLAAVAARDIADAAEVVDEVDASAVSADVAVDEVVASDEHVTTDDPAVTDGETTIEVVADVQTGETSSSADGQSE